MKVYTKRFSLSSVIILLLVLCSENYAQNTSAFSFTGAIQTFTVPPCVYTIHVKAWGAGGSGGGADIYSGAVGGAGSCVESDIAVIPGQILTIIIGGGAGPGGSTTSSAPGGSAGWGNGILEGGPGGVAGASGFSGGGGGGGGGTAILSGTSLILVVGGGGGGSGGGMTSSGATGGGGGQNGNPVPGSCSSPGIAGASPTGNGSIGSNKGGGDGGGGGGGGGGYYGGSGGGVATGCDCGACGGGGGTSWSSGLNTIITNGNGQTPGNNTDPALPLGVAVGGGTSTKGGDGFLLLVYSVPPIAKFTNTSVCAGNATQFTDSTMNFSGTVVSWAWDFGDGSPIDTTQNTSHLYASGGSYNATLIVSNSFGCDDTITQPVQVFYNPTANFTHNYVCLGDSMYFVNSSSVSASSSIASYLWSFGDGSATSNIQHPVHYYSLPGTYNLTLVTTTVDACTDAISNPVNACDAPVPSFTPSPACAGADSVHFTNTTASPVMGTIAGWLWDFGDGTPLNASVWSPSHLYTFAGNYVVMLITYSSNGCRDTLKSTITVFPMPHANFAVTDVCLNQIMSFSDLSGVSGGAITAWSWNFGDGSPPITNQNAGYSYTNAGHYIATLIATSNNGCIDTVSKSVLVHSLPHAQFLTANVCDATFAQFVDSSTVLSPDLIYFYSWNFGDGTTVNNQNPSHLYSAPGTYTVQLLTVSNFGCKDSLSKALTVNPNPVVYFIANDTIGCEPLCTNFQNISSIATGSNTQWFWNFGDGSTLNSAQNPSHCFANDSLFSPINYSVSLTVTSDKGCTGTLAKNNYITVYPLPVAGFAVQPETATIIDPVISFTDVSIGANFWNWNFGDMTTSSMVNPMPHIYADTGTYQVTLTVSTQHGCTDMDYHTVTIEPDFLFYIPNAFSPNNDGINDYFSAKGVFIKEFEMMIFDRWGNKIFESNDYNVPWDGKAKDGKEISEADVYIYVITLTDIKKKKHDYEGVVTLVR